MFLFIISIVSNLNAAIIENYRLCSSKIGNGANLISYLDDNLLGKCQGYVLPPSYSRGIITFQTLNYNSISNRVVDRTELAFVKNTIQLNKVYNISFDVKIDKNSDNTDTWFYIFQLWQNKELPPIFSGRISRGSSNNLAFVIRNPENHQAGKVISRINLSDKEWYSFSIKLFIGSDSNSFLNIYKDNTHFLSWNGNIGYPLIFPYKDFRFKFGIYKEHENNKKFKILFKNVKITML